MATKQCTTCGTALDPKRTHLCPALSPEDAVRAAFESVLGTLTSAHAPDEGPSRPEATTAEPGNAPSLPDRPDPGPPDLPASPHAEHKPIVGGAAQQGHDDDSPSHGECGSADSDSPRDTPMVWDTGPDDVVEADLRRRRRFRLDWRGKNERVAAAALASTGALVVCALWGPGSTRDSSPTSPAPTVQATSPPADMGEPSRTPGGRPPLEDSAAADEDSVGARRSPGSAASPDGAARGGARPAERGTKEGEAAPSVPSTAAEKSSAGSAEGGSRGVSVLSEGARGPEVEDLQRRLKRSLCLCYLLGPVNGVYDRNVTRAVSSYQASRKVEGDANGVYGINTRRALEAETS